MFLFLHLSMFMCDILWRCPDYLSILVFKKYPNYAQPFPNLNLNYHASLRYNRVFLSLEKMAKHHVTFLAFVDAHLWHFLMMSRLPFNPFVQKIPKLCKIISEFEFKLQSFSQIYEGLSKFGKNNNTSCFFFGICRCSSLTFFDAVQIDSLSFCSKNTQIILSHFRIWI